eukprot:2136699-Alexandrium_andersonii.AAC.1
MVALRSSLAALGRRPSCRPDRRLGCPMGEAWGFGLAAWVLLLTLSFNHSFAHSAILSLWLAIVGLALAGVGCGLRPLGLGCRRVSG